MERKLLERMIGAGVLLLALVIIAPALLDGGAGLPANPDIPGQRSDELRTHVFRLDEGARAALPAESLPSVAPDAPSAVGGETSRGVAQVPTEPQPVIAPAAPPPVDAEAPRGDSTTGSGLAAVPDKPAPAAAPAGAWLVQVGTFGQKANAERLAASLRDRGFATDVSPTSRGEKTLFRVRVGPPGSRADAEGLRTRLQAAGQTGQVVGR